MTKNKNRERNVALEKAQDSLMFSRVINVVLVTLLASALFGISTQYKSLVDETDRANFWRDITTDLLKIERH